MIANGTKGDGVNSGPHAWNIVRIGNTWFHMDTTWSRFNLNDTVAKSEYYKWNASVVPLCSGSYSAPAGLSLFVDGDYIYATNGTGLNSHIIRYKLDGSEYTHLFTTKNPAPLFLWMKDGYTILITKDQRYTGKSPTDPMKH